MNGLLPAPPELAVWAALVGERSLHQTGALLSFSEHDKRLHVVQSGLIRLHCIDAAGNPRTLRRVGVGGLFGEETLVDAPRLYVAEAMQPSVICSFSAQRLSAQERASLVLGLAEGLRHNQARLRASLGKKMRSRVAWELLELASTPLGKRNAEGHLCLEFTHDELANELGAARETITRTLGNLAAAGCLELSGGQITILDEAALQEAAR